MRAKRETNLDPLANPCYVMTADHVTESNHHSSLLSMDSECGGFVQLTLLDQHGKEHKEPLTCTQFRYQKFKSTWRKIEIKVSETLDEQQSAHLAPVLEFVEKSYQNSQLPVVQIPCAWLQCSATRTDNESMYEHLIYQLKHCGFKVAQWLGMNATMTADKWIASAVQQWTNEPSLTELRQCVQQNEIWVLLCDSFQRMDSWLPIFANHVPRLKIVLLCAHDALPDLSHRTRLHLSSHFFSLLAPEKTLDALIQSLCLDASLFHLTAKIFIPLMKSFDEQHLSVFAFLQGFKLLVLEYFMVQPLSLLFGETMNKEEDETDEMDSSNSDSDIMDHFIPAHADMIRALPSMRSVFNASNEIMLRNDASLYAMMPVYLNQWKISQKLFSQRILCLHSLMRLIEPSARLASTLLHVLTLNKEKFTTMTGFVRVMSRDRLKLWLDQCVGYLVNDEELSALLPALETEDRGNASTLNFYKHLVQLLLNRSMLPLHEIHSLNDPSALNKLLYATPRATMHAALTQSHLYMTCPCCRSTKSCHSQMTDTCLVYRLMLECGKWINVHDWYEAFLSIRDDSQSPKDSLLMRFLFAVSQLQWMGYCRPTERKTDHMQRLTSTK